MSIQACIMSHAVSAPLESHGLLLQSCRRPVDPLCPLQATCPA